MKKVLLLALVIGLALSFSSCDIATNTSGSSVSSSDSGSNSKAVKIDKSITLPNLTFTAIEIETSAGKNGMKPATEGYIFVAVKLKVENTSDKDQLIAGIVTFDNYADDTKCLFSTGGATVFTPMINGTLAAGKNMTGYHVVETPADAKVLTLKFTSTMDSTQGSKGESFVIDMPK